MEDLTKGKETLAASYKSKSLFWKPRDFFGFLNSPELDVMVEVQRKGQMSNGAEFAQVKIYMRSKTGLGIILDDACPPLLKWQKVIKVKATSNLLGDFITVETLEGQQYDVRPQSFRSLEEQEDVERTTG